MSFSAAKYPVGCMRRARTHSPLTCPLPLAIRPHPRPPSLRSLVGAEGKKFLPAHTPDNGRVTSKTFAPRSKCIPHTLSHNALDWQ